MPRKKQWRVGDVSSGHENNTKMPGKKQGKVGDGSSGRKNTSSARRQQQDEKLFQRVSARNPTEIQHPVPQQQMTGPKAQTMCGSLTYSIVFDEENNTIITHIQSYKRNKTSQVKRYVKVNICQNGKRLKKTKRKTEIREGRGEFYFNETLKTSVAGGVKDNKNKYFLLAVWKKKTKKNSPECGILIPSSDITAGKYLKLESWDLFDYEFVQKDIENTESKQGTPCTGVDQHGDQNMVHGEKEQLDNSGPKVKVERKTETEGLHHRTADNTTAPTGLPNHGNTCYANSVLQVLRQTPNLNKELGSNDNDGSIQVNGGSVYLLKNIINNFGTTSLHSLLSHVFRSDVSFMFGVQNDSHSFLLALLQCLDDDTGRQACQLFEGYMLTRFEYSTCDHRELTEAQLFNSLLMPITDQRTLEGCISEFSKKMVFPDNTIPCRTCEAEGRLLNKSTITVKRTFLSKLPDILVFQMGRFEERQRPTETKIIQKKTTGIKYNDKIEMTEGIKSFRKREYRLYGVVNHSGSISGGHYTACVRTGLTDNWYYCSDSVVRPTSNPAKKTDSAAYLLFYHLMSE